MLAKLRREINQFTNREKAVILAGFFKTGKGEYGEGDIFAGLTVPQSRVLAKKYRNLSFGEIRELLRSKIHEERLIALLILVDNFKLGSIMGKKKIVDFYLKNTKFVNNWDLVDLSADKIVGDYLIGRDKSALLRLANSKNLWERRIAIIATYQFIKVKKEFDWTFKIAEVLLSDKHDLIHKAVGWMLREVGKRNQEAEEKFLSKFYKIMPRTTLRYAIERFGPEKREFYMKKENIR